MKRGEFATIWATVRLILGAVDKYGQEEVISTLKEVCLERGPDYEDDVYQDVIGVLKAIKDKVEREEEDKDE
jgi:hypothetical protein